MSPYNSMLNKRMVYNIRTIPKQGVSKIIFRNLEVTIEKKRGL